MFKKTIPFIIIFSLFLSALPVNAYVPSDPLYGDQWYLSKINAEKAWDSAKGDGVIVAVLDSGIDIDHPDLKSNIWTNNKEIPGNWKDDDGNGYIDDVRGWDFITGTNDPKPKFETGYNNFGMHHGTAVSGIIAATANNGEGITGVAFNAKIMALRVLSSNGEGNVASLVNAIKYAVNNGASIINLSLVGDNFSDSLQETINWASKKGVLVVAAVGNGDNGKGIDLNATPKYPVCYGNNSDNNIILGVASVDNTDIKSIFSNYGDSCVDLVAPGEFIESLAFYSVQKEGFKNYYSAYWNGTSMASAIISGVAALVKSKDPSATPKQIIDVLMSSAVKVDNQNVDYKDELGAGRINAGLALDSVVTASIDPSRGYVAKLSNSSAVYYIDQNNIRHLFSNEYTYWTWYKGTWAEQGIKVISQDEFDQLRIGSNVTVRAGTLIKFENSPRTYAVTPGAGLCQIFDESAALSLYGNSFKKRVKLIQNAFELDYINNRDCILTAESKYPNGSLIQYQDSGYVWYIENGLKRQVTDGAFEINSFDNQNLVIDVAPDMNYDSGTSISGLSLIHI